MTADGSLLGSLRAKRERLAAEKTTEIPVAGYGGELVVRYHLCDPLVEGKEIGARVLDQFKGPGLEEERLYYLLVDSVIAACDGIFARVDGDLVSIDPAGDTVDFGDPQLGEFLGFTADNARDSALAVFGGNRIALTQHAQQLQQWMGDTTGELNRSTFG